MGAPNATAASAAAWTNVSLPEMPLSHRFAQLDEQLHATFPGPVAGADGSARRHLPGRDGANGLALYVFGRLSVPRRSCFVTHTINLVVI